MLLGTRLKFAKNIPHSPVCRRAMLALLFYYFIFEVIVIEVLYQLCERLCDLATLCFRAIAIISARIFFDYP